MTDEQANAETRLERRAEERGDFLSYVWGVCISLLLSLAAFALVHWAGLSRFSLLIAIGGLALVQLLVQFRCFLHIGFGHKREDLQLILFSGLLLIIMVTGTIWIMASLATRMVVSMPA